MELTESCMTSSAAKEVSQQQELQFSSSSAGAGMDVAIAVVRYLPLDARVWI